MTPAPHILAIDAGTTGVTALLFSAELERKGVAYAEFAQHFPRPGCVEHDAAEILAAVDRTVAEVLAGFDGTVAAVGITNQRETVFALDARTGRVLGRGIVWQDRRTSARCEELRAAGHEPTVRRLTGLVLDPYFSATKMEWLLRERAEVAAAARAGVLRFATVDALVARHLTRGAELATDLTNASRTLLFDIDARRWSDELCDLFGIDGGMLPEVRGSTADFGSAALPGGRTAPLTGVAGDQQAALFGQGCFDAGAAKSTYGTGNFLVMNTGTERSDSAARLLTTLAVSHGGESCYALEGSVFSCGTIVQWLRDELGFLARASDSEAIATSVPDTGGVTLVPAFTGLGAPYWDPDARAAILGITRGTKPAHIVRAGLDAIAFQCAEVVEAMREASGLEIAELLVDGGAASNDYLMQRQADVAALVVARPGEVEATALGAAALAGVGASLFEDPRATRAFASPATRFEPRLAPSEREAELSEFRRAVSRVLTRA